MPKVELSRGGHVRVFPLIRGDEGVVLEVGNAAGRVQQVTLDDSDEIDRVINLVIYLEGDDSDEEE